MERNRWNMIKRDIIAKKNKKEKEKVIQVLSKYGTFLHGLVCLIVTLYLTFISLSHFLENNDTSVINSREFNFRPMDVYPTYTICMEDARKFWETMYHDGIYQSWYIKNVKGVKWPWNRMHLKPWHKYRKFLKGEIIGKYEEQVNRERELMSEIDFTKATKPLAKFMEKMEVVETILTETKYSLIKRNKPGNRSTFESMLFLIDQSPNTLCYTRKSSSITGYRKIKEKLTFRGKDVFGLHLTGLNVFAHHPGQFRRRKNQIVRVDLWGRSSDQRFDNTNYDIEIVSTNILRRRKDANRQCNDKIDSDDDTHWIKSAIEILDCIPPFWKPFYEWQNSTFSTCKTSEEFKKYYDLLNNPLDRLKVLNGYEQPCAEMSIGVIKNKFYDTDYDSFGKRVPLGGNMSIIIKYPEDNYHEILNMKQITFDSFWSSTGGFIGMFLGFSIMQVPQFVFGVVMWSINRNN